VQVDADREAENRGANQYERPEDVETGQSTGVDRNNTADGLRGGDRGPRSGGHRDRRQRRRTGPTATSTSVREAGNVATGFASPDNLALDRRGNLAITEDPARNTVEPTSGSRCRRSPGPTTSTGDTVPR
jgi:secreted PhoX family phosphatase